MAKPYSIQSPEDIAKQYAGNKQKIGEAMQMGIIDPTAGVLAGMFIDRMRGAQAQEGANPPTVAQQVMGGLPPAPPAPLPLTGGLGAAPQEAPPMAPEMPAMPEAPMGMAAGGTTYEPPYAKGGLSDVPIPDTMIDEPGNGGFNDGYAGGGIVAFAQGGLGWANSSVTSPYGEKRSYEVHPGIDFGVANKTPIGVVGGGVVETASRDNVNGNYVIVRHPNGMTTSYSHLSTLDVKPGQQLGAGDLVGLSGNTGRVRGASGGYHLHFGAKDAEGRRIDPNDILKDPSILGTGDRPPVPERDQDTAEGRLGSLSDIVAAVQGINRKSDEELGYEKRVKARLEEKASDENYEKQRKADMWQTLAEIGFNMASSKSPYVLQAIGEAAAASMPGARADKKDRKEAKDRALEGLMELGARNRKEAMDALQVAIPVWQAGMSAEQFERTLQDKALDRKHDMDMLDRRITAELTAAGITASAKDRDIWSQAAQARYAELKRINETLPVKERKADSTLMDMALTGVLGMKSTQSGSGASLEELLKTQGGGAGAGTGGFTVTRE